MKSLPRSIVLLALVGLLAFGLPVVGLLVRVPWRDAAAVLGDDGTRTALVTSLWSAGAAVGIAIVLGLPVALLLARLQGTARTVARVVVALPVVMPPVVGGVALLAIFGRTTSPGRALASLGVRLPFTLAGTIVAVSFVSVPLFILAAESGVRGVGARLEGAAATLGAHPGRVLWSVTLPGARRALIAGALLTFTRALGEFGATITFAGNLRGRTQTLPLAVYESLQVDPAGALVLSALLIAIAVLALVVFGDKVRR